MSSRCRPKLTSFRKRIGNESGLTLIEMLLAISIMLFMSVGIYQIMTRTFKLRDSLMQEGDFFNGIRLSMGVLDRDITLLYSPTVMKPTLPPSTDPNAREFNSTFRSTQYWSAPTDTTGVRASRLIGTDQKLSFISASHIRLYKDAPESDFVKVSYALVKDEAKDAIPDTYVLVRTVSPSAFQEDDDRDERKKVYPLLGGIQKFKLEYYNFKREDWDRTWDSDHPDFAGTYPTRIRATLEVKGPLNFNFSGTYDFKPELPFNGLPSTL